jgi:hydroxyacylglutathione hydrolase
MVFLVTDHGGGANEPIAMLSGDFLFVGDAGRPDLLEQAAGIEGTQEQGARALYKSLRKVSELPCHVQVLPAHGAGSACGKALGSIPNSTFGYEEKFNPALKLALNESEEAFVKFILSGQPEPPAYFANLKRVNKVGPTVLGTLPEARLMSLDEILPHLNETGFVILDTRSRDEFLKGHLRGSLFTPPEKFSDFAGSYLSPEQEIVLIAENAAAAQEFIRQLVRIGFDHIAGFLPTTSHAAAPAEAIAKFAAVDFPAVPALLGKNGDSFVLDVRKATEFAGAHLRNAHNFAHTRLRPRLAEIPKVPLIIYCQTGQRATGASAFLARNGYTVTCVADKFENAPKAILT